MQIELINVSADYQLGPIRRSDVLNTVNLRIEPGTITALIGHTGAGKSSLLKTLNGLLLPTKGTVQVGDIVIEANKKNRLKELRKQVGMVFQFPESQLFAETVEKDICFGPMNFGTSMEEAKFIAREVIKMVGLEPSILTKSPFSLSGGQKRRVAIAGILAMKPKVLILDEPGAGLDPKGKKEILSLLTSWHKQEGLTTILVTHDMEDVAEFCDQVMIMDQGKVVMHDEIRQVFNELEGLKKWKVELPEARRYQLKIEQETGVKLPGVCLTVKELANALMMVELL